MVYALRELRDLYASLGSSQESKVRVKIETLLSLLIYVMVKADLADIITEYKIMKVYFLLSRDYNHNRLVYLLKSAIKSINKVGVGFAKHIV